MNRFLAWLRRLGNAGAIDNVSTVLDRRRRDDNAIDALVSRLA